MNFINTILGTPLGYILFACYNLVQNYGLAILLFAVIVKVIFFPLSVAAQKNSIRLLKLQPALDEIKLRYAGEKDIINEEQYNLFKKEKYSPLTGSIPMLVQLVLIIGVLQVMYNPLQHILRLDKDVISTLSNTTQQIVGPTTGPGEQLRIIDLVHQPEYIGRFEEALSDYPDKTEVINKIQKVDLNFLGLNLGEIPSFSEPSTLLLIPVLAGLSSLLLSIVQNALSPGTKYQSAVSKWGMTAFLVAFSIYFTLVAPSGVGIYWIASNLLGIVVAFILNALYNPEKLASVAAPPAKVKLTREEREKKKEHQAELSIRERKDGKLFEEAKKELVFYSVSSGQYKYFETVIDYILSHSDIKIHYLTNDENDKIFSKANEQLIPYYVGPEKIISTMLKLEADMVVMTVPDLQKYHIKKSIVSPDIEYVYMFHAISSYHLTLREGALDAFDTIFCVGPFNAEETRRIEELEGIPRRRLVKVGSSHLDTLMLSLENLPEREDKTPQILIAPSWQIDNLMDLCLDEVVEPLLGKGYKVVLRPHPEYIKRFPQRMETIKKRYSDRGKDGFVFDLDFLNSENIYQSDVLITDWSTIAFEFSFCTKNPCVFVNTPIKVMNPNYKKLDIEIVDIALRDMVGRSLNVSELDSIYDTVEDMLVNKDFYRSSIEEAKQKYIYHPGRSGEAGGKYIIQRLRGSSE